MNIVKQSKNEKIELKNSKWLVIFGVFALFFIILMGNYSRIWGFSDECDNFAGGLVVAKGGMLYRDYISQHMPVMYYLCAIFHLLGANTVYLYRLYFYIVFALMWTAVYFRYSFKFGKVPMLICPLIYFCNMYTYYNSGVLSDQLQAVGMVILLLEYLWYLDTNEMTVKSSVWLSFAIFISFGTAFMAGLAVFVIAVSVFINEIIDAVKEKKTCKEFVIAIARKYWKMVVIICLPFAILLVYYLLNHNFKNFVYGAYEINRTIYPKYIAGYGAGIASTILGTIDSYFSTFKNSLTGILSDTLGNFRILLCYVVNVCYLIRTFQKKKIGKTITIIAFMLMCGVRGFGCDFHALPYFAVTAFMAAWLLQEFFASKEKKNMIYALALAFSAFIFVIPYGEQFTSILSAKSVALQKPSEYEMNYSYYITRLTDKEEKVLYCTLDFAEIANSNRSIVPIGVSTPWTHEAYEEEDIQNVKEANPRVILYNPDYTLWSYNLSDYAQDFMDYIEKNYTCLEVENMPYLYVRNDYYKEASMKLENMN